MEKEIILKRDPALIGKTFSCFKCEHEMQHVGIFVYCKKCNLLFSVRSYRELHKDHIA